MGIADDGRRRVKATPSSWVGTAAAASTDGMVGDYEGQYTEHVRHQASRMQNFEVHY